MRWIVAAFVAGFGLSALAPAIAAQAESPRAEAADYRFRGTTGLLVFHVRLDRTRDFEEVVDRIRRGLDVTSHPLRREQAAGWRVFRSTDAPGGAVYVMVFDPVVRDGDYDPVKMLTELAPADVRTLYEQLKAAVIRVERLDLERIR